MTVYIYCTCYAPNMLYKWDCKSSVFVNICFYKLTNKPFADPRELSFLDDHINTHYRINAFFNIIPFVSVQRVKAIPPFKVYYVQPLHLKGLTEDANSYPSEWRG